MRLSLRHVVVFFFDIRRQVSGTACPTCSLRLPHRRSSACSSFSTDRTMSTCCCKHLAIFGTDHRFDLLEVVAQIVQHTGQHRPVLSLAVQLVEHLVGIADRSDRLVRAGIGQACPSVGAIGNHHAEFERPESGLRCGIGLQLVLQMLVDRDPHRPTGRRIGSALDVAGKQLDTGQQATDAPHVAVAIAFDLDCRHRAASAVGS